ncbi:MAG: hypothetical protein QW390_01300 [Candidatus Bathyarchaeia archaeon]
MDTVVDQLPRHDDPYAIYAYTALYTSVNARLDWITLSLARRMREKGFEAYQIPASQP